MIIISIDLCYRKNENLKEKQKEWNSKILLILFATIVLVVLNIHFNYLVIFYNLLLSKLYNDTLIISSAAICLWQITFLLLKKLKL